MAGHTTARRRYERLFFVGVAIVIVLLPFPNVFGIVLDGLVLAIANPILGNRATLALLLVYNFNPVKLNGVIGLYYLTYAIVYYLVSQMSGVVNPPLTSAVVIALLFALTIVEYFAIRGVSALLWSRLQPRMRTF